MMGQYRRRLVRRGCWLAAVIALPVSAVGVSRATGAEPARLTDVAVVTAPDVTRIDIKTSLPARYEATFVAEPPQLVIDFDNTTYAWRPTPLAVTAGPLKEIRGSQHRPGVARIAIEFQQRVSYAVHDMPDGVAITIPTRLAGDTPTPPAPPARPPEPALPPPPKDPLDLERVKRALAQIPVESAPAAPQSPAAGTPPPGTPASPFEPRREPVAVTLQESIDLALKRNLELRSTSLVTQSTELEIPKARAKFHPTVGFALTASGIRSFPEMARPTTLTSILLTPIAVQELPTGGRLVLSSDFSREETHPASTPVGFSSAVTLSLVQPLFRGGRTYVATQAIRNAEFDSRIANDALRADILRVTVATKTAYYNVLLAEKVIAVTEAAIDRDKALIAASQALFQARLVTKRDVFSAELSLAQDSAKLVSARADLEVAKNALADILGLPIAADVMLLDKEVDFEPVQLDVGRLIATATGRRPEILAGEEQLAKNALAIRVARNAVLPQFDLVASYGRAQTRSIFSRSLELGGDVWSAGVVFSFPIGNVAARATLSQAEIEQSRLQLALTQTKRQIELEVRTAVIKLQKSVERIRALTVAIEQAKGKLEVGKVQFALGQATNLDITDAQQAILSAEVDLLTAIVDYNIGQAELEASIAGPLRLP
jgi:outer membrane protein TolC